MARTGFWVLDMRETASPKQSLGTKKLVLPPQETQFSPPNIWATEKPSDRLLSCRKQTLLFQTLKPQQKQLHPPLPKNGHNSPLQTLKPRKKQTFVLPHGKTNRASPSRHSNSNCGKNTFVPSPPPSHKNGLNFPLRTLKLQNKNRTHRKTDAVS